MKKLMLLLFSIPSIYCQTLEINIEVNRFGVDNQNNIVVSHINNISSYNDLSNYTDISIFFDTQNFQFNNIPNSLQYDTSYIIENNNINYQLFFTQIPIISVSTDNIIVDEPKTDAIFTYSDDFQNFSSIIGIELRGGFSQTFPKKTYDLEFWTDITGDESENQQFGDLRNDDDWVLDALYNEPLRIRTFISHKLWLDMHEPYYLDDEPNAKSGADVMYVEMFLNNIYNGIYLLSEQVDKKQLKIKSYDNDTNTIRGEIYKAVSWEGAVTYNSLVDYDNNSRHWHGFDMKYPKESQVTDWQNLYDFIDFVINSSDSDFNNQIWSKFNKENSIDYFIFLNLIRATDNRGKNIYLSKYNQNSPYFNAPWDLDGSWGLIWDGSYQNITNDILTNGLYLRLFQQNPDNFLTSLKNRWFFLRSNIISNISIENSFDSVYTMFNENNIYAREALVFPNYPFNEEARTYTSTWIEERILFLDNYFGAIIGIDDFSIENTLKIHPIPSNDFIKIEQTFIKNSDFKIYNLQGIEITKGKLSSKNTINIKNLQPGVYLLKIDNFSSKIIKN